MNRCVQVYVPSCWYLGYQISPSGWRGRFVVLDLAIIPPLVLRVDFGRIAHLLFDDCHLCVPPKKEIGYGYTGLVKYRGFWVRASALLWRQK